MTKTKQRKHRASAKRPNSPVNRAGDQDRV